MGSGIAIAFANAGREVTLIDNDEAALALGHDTLRSTHQSSVQRGRIDQNVADERIARITAGMALAEAANADLVIEAVFEDMDLKKRVLSSLDSILPPERLIATNTSTLPITELGRATAHPRRVLGLHFFAPEPKMALATAERQEWLVDAISDKKPRSKLVSHSHGGHSLLRWFEALAAARRERITGELTSVGFQGVDTAIRVFVSEGTLN
jgi:3-hydroxyacyl-CoA dehydrogenase